jgi:hypothetical protein
MHRHNSKLQEEEEKEGNKTKEVKKVKFIMTQKLDIADSYTLYYDEL